MNLEQCEPEARERIEEHLGKYSSGRLTPHDGDFESLESEVVYIRATTLKEAKSILETARLMGHFTEFIEGCYCAHDCCGHVSTGAIKIQRIDNYSFIAIHSFTINV